MLDPTGVCAWKGERWRRRVRNSISTVRRSVKYGPYIYYSTTVESSLGVRSSPFYLYSLSHSRSRRRCQFWRDLTRLTAAVQSSPISLAFLSVRFQTQIVDILQSKPSSRGCRRCDRVEFPKQRR
ncbi:hypothetical protein EXIGLDRAFT_283766 [Exidia glandulosa HHB12029]|uniref:Uncharacterized protein n=1 Tax=Exidia glandulosa HHB12029 TaxID=1314781 RepID=A0A165DHB5_EXIGL|nr:hypothetical protein EXIGLDRAFT_283766 [Exidia glandulosa HHB12029]